MKDMLRKINENVKAQAFLQFVKFGIVGLSNTLISLMVYYIFLYIGPGLYMAGNVAGWVVSVANAYFWNNRYVFKDAGGGAARKLLKTYVSYGASFLLATGLLAVQVEILGVSRGIAPAINLLVTVPLNFVVSKFWTFKKNRTAK